MSYRLIALDLDGTLLNAAAQVPQVHKAAVRQAMAQGLEIIIVTGRSWGEMELFYRDLGLTTPAITLLGAQVVDGHGHLIWEQRMDPAAAAAVANAADAGGWALSAVFDSGVAHATRRPHDFTHWEQWNPFTHISGSLAPRVAVQSPLFIAAYGKQACDACLAEFPAGLPATQWDLHAPQPDDMALFYWHREVDKGRALAAFCAGRGIQAAEVVALGDSTGDLAMLRWAGTGVAMAVAPPHVQAECALVTAADDPHPVATALQRLGILSAVPGI